MQLLAIIRGIVLILTMAIYLVIYGLTRFIWPHTRASAFRLRRHWVKYMCLPILNIKVDLIGRPIVTPALYVCNHRSFLDPAIKSVWLDALVIAKAEIADYPIINKGAEVTGIIWVNRSDKDSRSATRQTMIDTIKSGYNILVYPEGTVSAVQHALPFKKGTFVAAANEGFSVVPVTLEYRDESDLWYNHGLIKQYFRQCSKWAIHTKVTFGEPIKSESSETLLEQTFTTINTEMTRMQQDWSTVFVNS